MSAGKSNGPNWIDRLKADLKRDKKRTGILCALIVVASIVGGRFLLQRLTPSKVQASVTPIVADAPPTVSRRTTPPLPGTRSGEPVDRTASALGRSRRPISRDLFTPDPRFFPLGQSVYATDQATTNPSGGSDEGAIRARAQILTLESTIVGTRPTAIINGSFVRVGEWVNGFKVTRITERMCELECKGVKVVKEMVQSGDLP